MFVLIVRLWMLRYIPAIQWSREIRNGSLYDSSDDQLSQPIAMPWQEMVHCFQIYQTECPCPKATERILLGRIAGEKGTDPKEELEAAPKPVSVSDVASALDPNTKCES